MWSHLNAGIHSVGHRYSAAAVVVWLFWFGGSGGDGYVVLDVAPPQHSEMRALARINHTKHTQFFTAVAYAENHTTNELTPFRGIFPTTVCDGNTFL